MSTSIRTLDESDGLGFLEDELNYTVARLKARVETKHLAPPLEALRERRDEIERGQRKAWRTEVEAQAVVDVADEDLEELIVELESELDHKGGRESPRYRRYIPEGPSALTRLSLGATVEALKMWPRMLGGEPEAELQELGQRFEQRLAVGRKALEDRTVAATDTGSHRAREILTLFDDVNAARTSLLADLLQLAVRLKKPKSWASRFFRRGTSEARGKKKKKPTDPSDAEKS